MIREGTVVSRQVMFGAQGSARWLLRAHGDGWDDLGYAKRTGWRRWKWLDERRQPLAEGFRSLTQVVRHAQRTVPKGEDVGPPLFAP